MSLFDIGAIVGCFIVLALAVGVVIAAMLIGAAIERAIFGE